MEQDAIGRLFSHGNIIQGGSFTMPAPAIMMCTIAALAATILFHGTAHATTPPGVADIPIGRAPNERSIIERSELASTPDIADQDTTLGPYTPPTLLVGISAGVNMAMHLGMRPPDDLVNDVTPVSRGFDINPFMGLHAVWFFTGDGRGALTTRISYDDRSFTMESPDRDLTFVDRNGEVHSVPAEYQIAADYTLITTDILMSYDLFGSGLAVLGGPSIGVVLSEDRRDAHVPTSGFASAYQLDAATRPLRFGIKGGLQYTLRSEHSMWLVPTILYDFGLTRVKDGEGWRSDALMIGIDFLLPLNGGYETSPEIE